jgi:hypothetical protein
LLGNGYFLSWYLKSLKKHKMHIEVAVRSNCKQGLIRRICSAAILLFNSTKQGR